MSSLKSGGIFVGNISFNRSVNMLRATSMLTKEEQEKISSFYYRETPERLKHMLLDAGFEIIEFEYRYEETRKGSVGHFLDWISATYNGEFDFKTAYENCNIDFVTYENGDVKHTSEGATFVVKKTDKKS